MPYNNTPIAPSSEVTGSTSLPLARVKKIISADPDTGACSNNAAFAIAVATEMFVQHLVEQTHNVVKSERRPRRNIQYKDVANAVARIDNLEFLADVVPRTMTFKQYKEKKAKEDASKASDAFANGQRTLDQMSKKDTDEGDINDTELDRSGQQNGVGPSQDRPSNHSPSNSRTGMQARFDAVRNGYDTRPEPTVPMEE